MKRTTLSLFAGVLLICAGYALIIAWYVRDLLYAYPLTQHFAGFLREHSHLIFAITIFLLFSGLFCLVLVYYSHVFSADLIPVKTDGLPAEDYEAQRLLNLAYRDPLTGLANRTKLNQDINHILGMAQRHDSGFALIFLDLDYFKKINDTVGHDAGDILLQVIAERLKNTLRNSDIVARLGGDEFVVVITEVSSMEVIARIAQQIQNNILKPVTIKGHELFITTSMGISFYPYDGQDIRSLMKNADLALYRAKEQGRNNYQFFTPEMTARAQEKITRQQALNTALIKEEFYLYYQPKINLAQYNINGVEALLRWKNKEFGVVSAHEIISLAEESGLIIPLSDWILKTACNQMKKWHEMGQSSLNLSVNVSGRQLKQPNFVESVANVLKQTNFPAKLLVLEVTEGVIMQDPESTLSILHSLKNTGVQIAIDDFGTGYSSLGYLSRFAFDIIKIDKTFIQRMTNEDTSASVVRAIIAMANKLDIKTLAEGVETLEQFQFLFREGCVEVQGFYFCPPLSTDRMTALINDPAAQNSVLEKMERF